MQDFDFAQIQSNLPKFDHFCPNFASVLPKSNQFSQIVSILPKFFSIGDTAASLTANVPHPSEQTNNRKILTNGMIGVIVHNTTDCAETEFGSCLFQLNSNLTLLGPDSWVKRCHDLAKWSG